MEMAFADSEQVVQSKKAMTIEVKESEEDFDITTKASSG